MSKTMSGAACAKSAIGLLSPNKIIDDLILSDDLPKMRCHLREMADAYILSEDDPNYRRSVYATYQVLDILLSRVEKITNKDRRAA
jgi:hypothetical protein